MFGCNNFCSYCIVPYVRGRERAGNRGEYKRSRAWWPTASSRSCSLGQNVNSYGKTLETPITFAGLLRRVEKIEGLRRIRFMTSHPKDLSDELIEVMRDSKKICRHLHLPLQSGSSRILKEMNRRYTKEQYLSLVDKIKTAIPDISLTTDIIVGFPGETEEDFEETMDVVRKVRYDSAFTFIYSRRTGTPAASMENQVPEDVVKRRFDRLLEEVQGHLRRGVRQGHGHGAGGPGGGSNDHAEGFLTGRLGQQHRRAFRGRPGASRNTRGCAPGRIQRIYYMGTLVKKENQGGNDNEKA